MKQLLFDEKGNLLGGVVTGYTLSDIKRDLADSFDKSQTRKQLFQELRSFLKMLNNDLVTRIWIDGSFCTQKENPRDIDVLIFLKPSAQTVSYREELERQTTPLVDKYCITDKDYIEASSPSYLLQLRNEKYWLGQFGFDRNRDRKGIIELKGSDFYETDNLL